MVRPPAGATPSRESVAATVAPPMTSVRANVIDCADGGTIPSTADTVRPRLAVTVSVLRSAVGVVVNTKDAPPACGGITTLLGTLPPDPVDPSEIVSDPVAGASPSSRTLAVVLAPPSTVGDEKETDCTEAGATTSVVGAA
jgi:hypothetical protein